MSNPFESPESFDSATPADRARVRLKRVGVLSVGMFFGVAGVLMGILAGLMMFATSFFAANAGPNANFPGAAIGAGFLIMAPILYGVMGFIAGIIYAAVYNLVASFSGGIELDFSPE